jgi:hypothetical protein
MERRGRRGEIEAEITHYIDIRIIPTHRNKLPIKRPSDMPYSSPKTPLISLPPPTSLHSSFFFFDGHATHTQILYVLRHIQSLVLNKLNKASCPPTIRYLFRRVY